MQSRLDDVFDAAPERTPRFLHVLNGDSTAEGLRQSDVPGTLAVWADVLHEGPVPPDDDLQAWLDIRSRFHAGEEGDAGDDRTMAVFRDWQSALDRFREYDEVVLWFEHDLFDQLLLIRHLGWWARQDHGRTVLKLICIGEFPGFPDFHGLGELSPDQLASLLDTRQTVTQHQIELGRSAWTAFTAADPTRLEHMLHQDTSSLPFLAGAIRRVLEEYPAVHTGLPRTERQILENLLAGPCSPDELFRASAKREERVFMGDTTFWDRLGLLASGRVPLVLWDEVKRPGRLAGGVVNISDTGRRVLDGQDDWIQLSGIDRWIGGVHLEGAGPHWRWDATRNVLVRA